MISTKKAEWIIGWILIAGITLSAMLILCGGILFLTHHDHASLQDTLQDTPTYKSLADIINTIISTKATSIIELGILLLVATQVLRVTLLAIFYATTKDIAFTIISLFILVMLLYSFIFPH